MNTIKGTVKNGQIAVSEPISWPDGTEVRVRPVRGINTRGSEADENSKLDAIEQTRDTESIARWIAEFDAIPPLEMTPEEEAEWQAARNSQRELDKGLSHSRIDKVWSGRE